MSNTGEIFKKSTFNQGIITEYNVWISELSKFNHITFDTDYGAIKRNPEGPPG